MTKSGDAREDWSAVLVHTNGRGRSFVTSMYRAIAVSNSRVLRCTPRARQLPDRLQQRAIDRDNSPFLSGERVDKTFIYLSGQVLAMPLLGPR